MVKEFKEITLHTLKVQVLFFVSLANYLEQILLLLQLNIRFGKEQKIDLHHTSNRQLTNQIGTLTLKNREILRNRIDSELLDQINDEV